LQDKKTFQNDHFLIEILQNNKIFHKRNIKKRKFRFLTWVRVFVKRIPLRGVQTCFWEGRLLLNSIKLVTRQTIRFSVYLGATGPPAARHRPASPRMAPPRHSAARLETRFCLLRLSQGYSAFLQRYPSPIVADATNSHCGIGHGTR